MYRSEEDHFRIKTIFKEFPFLKKYCAPFAVESVTVSRLDRRNVAFTPKKEAFLCRLIEEEYALLLDKDGVFLGEVEQGGTYNHHRFWPLNWLGRLWPTFHRGKSVLDAIKNLPQPWALAFVVLLEWKWKTCVIRILKLPREVANREITLIDWLNGLENQEQQLTRVELE